VLTTFRYEGGGGGLQEKGGLRGSPQEEGASEVKEELGQDSSLSDKKTVKARIEPLHKQVGEKNRQG